MNTKMTFISNKYTNWYYSIINSAKVRIISGYSESHHIIPKSLGGSNLQDNLVKLTAREHFICHRLLTHMTTGDNRKKMLYALGRFIQCNSIQERRFTARQYEIIRKAISEARTGNKHSAETKQKISKKRKGKFPWNKGLTGIVHSEESNIKRSNTLRGKTLEDKVGEIRAQEIKLKISQSKIGKPSGMTGKTHSRKGTHGLWKMSDESRKKISVARTGMKFSENHINNLTEANIINGLKRRGIPHRKTTCTFCGKVGSLSGMKRYHFTNCKDKTHEN
jgi:5-methylcytosine-specific restriction endonuclease McrA